MKAIFLAGAFLVLFEAGFALGVEPRQELSEESQACIACHSDINMNTDMNIYAII